MAQEEEKKVATDLEDEMEPLDSSEESDSEEDNAYQEDGFVVADDDGEGALSDEEMGGKDKPSKNRLKRLRKGGKRKRLELDQEDLDLIAFAQGQAPSSKVPKVREDAVNAGDAHTFSAASGSSTRTSLCSRCISLLPSQPFRLYFPTQFNMLPHQVLTVCLCVS